MGEKQDENNHLLARYFAHRERKEERGERKGREKGIAGEERKYTIRE